MEMAYGMWHFTHEMDNMFALSDRLTERQTDRLRDILFCKTESTPNFDHRVTERQFVADVLHPRSFCL